MRCERKASDWTTSHVLFACESVIEKGSRQLQMRIPSPNTATMRQTVATSFGDSFGATDFDKGATQSDAGRDVLLPVQPRRRMWWGSREDRVLQHHPNGRPWETIVKDRKQRPPGVHSREGVFKCIPCVAKLTTRAKIPKQTHKITHEFTSAGTPASPSRQQGSSLCSPDLGRMTTPLPFAEPRIVPRLGAPNRIYPIWMGPGMFLPDVAPAHYPGDPRRLGMSHLLNHLHVHVNR